MQGVGVVVRRSSPPTIQRRSLRATLLYDAMGAQFEITSAPPPSPAIRCAEFFITAKTSGGEKAASKTTRRRAMTVALRALDTAAEADTATGGWIAAERFFRSSKSSRAKGSPRCPNENRRCFQSGTSHDRRTLPLDGSVANRREYIETRLAATSPNRRGRLSRRNSLLTLGSTRQKMFRDLRSSGDGSDWPSGRHRTLAHGSNRAGEMRKDLRARPRMFPLRRLAHYSLSPVLKTAFEQVYGAPYLARMLFAEVGAKAAAVYFCAWTTTVRLRPMAEASRRCSKTSASLAGRSIHPN